MSRPRKNSTGEQASRLPEEFDRLSAQIHTGAGVLALPICLSMRPEQEDRHADTVLDPAGRRTDTANHRQYHVHAFPWRAGRTRVPGPISRFL